MILRRVLAVIMSVLVVGGGAITTRAVALDGERAQLFAQAEQLASQVTTTKARGEYLRVLIARNEDTQAELDGVLAVRGDFVAELAGLRTALRKAGGKIDTAAHLAAAHAMEATVLAERADPAVIANATATVHALAVKVDQEVAAWAATQQADDGAEQPWSSSGPDGYARVRTALNLVGGGGVGLYESSSCAGGSAPACANSDGYIKYRADVAGWGEARLNWAMAHELAHIFQFQVWGALNSSSSYFSLFGGDPEFLANCMALVRGYPGAVGCDGDQQIWASAIWVGVVQ